MNLMRHHSITIPLIFLLASCTQYKNIVYLQEKADAPQDSIDFYPRQIPTYRIQSRDVLYIRIVSMNQEITEVINQTAGTTTGAFNNESSLYISGYIVNDTGYIEIPIIGQIKVLDKTLEEAQAAITEQTLKFLKDPTVVVKLVSFKVFETKKTF